MHSQNLPSLFYQQTIAAVMICDGRYNKAWQQFEQKSSQQHTRKKK